jgi:hypothetical protein
MWLLSGAFIYTAWNRMDEKNDQVEKVRDFVTLSICTQRSANASQLLIV